MTKKIIILAAILNLFYITLLSSASSTNDVITLLEAKIKKDTLLEQYSGAIDLAIIKDPTLETKLSTLIDEEDNASAGMLRKLISLEKRFVKKIPQRRLQKLDPNSLSKKLTRRLIKFVDAKFASGSDVSSSILVTQSDGLYDSYLGRLQLFSYAQAMAMAPSMSDYCSSMCLQDMEMIQILDSAISKVDIGVWIGEEDPPPRIVSQIIVNPVYVITAINKLFCFPGYQKK